MADADEPYRSLYRTLLDRALTPTPPPAGRGTLRDLAAAAAYAPTLIPRTFVGFSSTDRWRFTQMQGWKAHEDINIDFADCQLDTAIRSDDPDYIKSVCREH